MFIKNGAFVDSTGQAIKFDTNASHIRITNGRGQILEFKPENDNWYSTRHKAIVAALRKLEDAIIQGIG